MIEFQVLITFFQSLRWLIFPKRAPDLIDLNNVPRERERVQRAFFLICSF